LLGGEHGGQPLALPIGEQVGAGAQHAADAVERVAGAAGLLAMVISKRARQDRHVSPIALPQWTQNPRGIGYASQSGWMSMPADCMAAVSGRWQMGSLARYRSPDLATPG
jgi:hypothetical protein